MTDHTITISIDATTALIAAERVREAVRELQRALEQLPLITQVIKVEDKGDAQ